MELPGIIASGLISLCCTVLVIYFFYIYGAFKHPVIAYLLMILSAAVPFVMTVGILPYDISLAFSVSHEDMNQSLLLTLKILYWLSFSLTWIIVPAIVSFLRYSHSISLRHRIWLTIRENLIFYGIVLAIVIIFIIYLLAAKDYSWDALIPLFISLANGYGLVLLCGLLGHGLVALPRTVWQMATPGNRYLFNLHKIARETEIAITLVADAQSAIAHCREVRAKLSGYLRRQFDSLGQPRCYRLDQLKTAVPLPDMYLSNESKNRQLQKFRKLDWSTASTSDLEDLFSFLDDLSTGLEESRNILQDSGETSLRALEKYEKSHSTIILTLLQRFGAILIVLINLACVWSEVCLMFNNKLSSFYILTHLTVSDLIRQLVISTPVLGYLMFVGSWSLTHYKLGSFFRFTKGATNANTLNYFAVFLSRLGPTIGFHYIQQIGGNKSAFQKVMGVMDRIIIIGRQWNIYSPVLLLLMILFFAFKVPDMVAHSCGKETFSLDYSIIDYEHLQKGENMFMALQPKARDLILSGYRYTTIVSSTRKSKQRIERSGERSNLESSFYSVE